MTYDGWRRTPSYGKSSHGLWPGVLKRYFTKTKRYIKVCFNYRLMEISYIKCYELGIKNEMIEFLWKSIQYIVYTECVCHILVQTKLLLVRYSIKKYGTRKLLNYCFFHQEYYQTWGSTWTRINYLIKFKEVYGLSQEFPIGSMFLIHNMIKWRIFVTICLDL